MSIVWNDVNWGLREPVTSAKLQNMVDNDEVLKAYVEAAPRGILKVARLKTSVSSTDRWWDPPGLELTADYEANRIIRASLHWRGIATVGMTGIWSVQIQTNSSGAWKAISETMIDLRRDWLHTEGGSSFAIGRSGAQGTASWRASLRRIEDGGSGGTVWTAEDTSNSFLVVEDCGANIQGSF